MSEQGQGFLAAVPLKYTYLVKSVKDSYIYESNTGLWKSISPDNDLILQLIPQQSANDYRIIDNFSSMSKQISHAGSDDVLFVSDSRANEHLLHLNIDTSSHESGVNEHLRLLRHYQQFDLKSILIDRAKFKCLFANDSSGDLASDIKLQLTGLAKFCNVEILISDRVEYFNLSVNNESSSDLNNQNVYLYIIGDADDTTFAETRLRIFTDSCLGLFVDSLEIPLSLIPLVGGMEFGNFKAIAKETGVNLYLPSVIPELYSSSSKHNLNLLFFSGLESHVLLAKKLLLELKEETEEQIYYKNIKILKFKKDSILLNRKNDISAIMYKYGAFIQMSPLGHGDATVHFEACSDELVELSINDFSTLSTEIYQADIWIHKNELATGSGVLPAPLNVSPEELKSVLCKISIATNVLIYADHRSELFTLLGTQDDTVKAIKLFKSSAPQLYGDFKETIKFKIELGLVYHEFISGKKNGKIAKITNSSRCTSIDFHPLNEYNMVVDMASTDFSDFLSSFSQLQQEFPSEVKFYIPESFHRQIIGTGGAVIQAIMRKYNVFVKFSNSFDQKNNAKSHVRYDNVIIRCPFKNSSNISLVKNELNSLLINNENITFFNTYFKMSRNQYRLLDFDKIQEIEKKTSTFVKFPSTEPTDFVIAEVLGTDTQSINATRLIITELADSYEFKITHSPKFHKIVNDSNEAFAEKIKVPFKLLYKFEIMAIDKKSMNSGSYHAIILSYPPESDLFLEEAIGHLTTFLRDQEFTIIDRGELSNNDIIISGSASSHGVASVPSSANSMSNNGYASLPSSANASMQLQLPHSQQLYQLPSFQSHQRFSIPQPTFLQPFAGAVPTSGYQRKRTTSQNGYQRQQKHRNTGF